MQEINILLVDDAAINRFLVIQYLQSWQDAEVRIDEAGNGLEAVEKVKGNNYDIILLDIRMPEMNGYEAAKVIRSLKDYNVNRTPIIALTADIAGDLEHKKGDIFTDVVAKPFNPDDLYAKVIKHTSGIRSNVPKEKGECVEENPVEIINYKDAEASFKGNTAKLLNFYLMAEKTLAESQKSYRKAMQQFDIVALDNINHKITLTLKVLGLAETLQTCMKEGKVLAEQKASQEEVNAFLDDITRWFDEVIEAVGSRHDHIMQHGL